MSRPTTDRALLAEAVGRIREHAARLSPERAQYLLDTADEMQLTDPSVDDLSIEVLAALMGRTREENQ